MKEYICACSVSSAGDSDWGRGRFFLLNRQIRAVTYALEGGILAACSGVGCIATWLSIDLKGKLAEHKAVLLSKQLIICRLTMKYLPLSTTFHNYGGIWKAVLSLVCCIFFCWIFSVVYLPPPPPPPSGMCEYEWLRQGLWVCEQCLK